LDGANCSFANLSEAVIIGLDLENLDLTGAILKGVKLTAEDLIKSLL